MGNIVLQAFEGLLSDSLVGVHNFLMEYEKYLKARGSVWKSWTSWMSTEESEIRQVLHCMKDNLE